MMFIQRAHEASSTNDLCKPAESCVQGKFKDGEAEEEDSEGKEKCRGLTMLRKERNIERSVCG